MSEVDRHAPPTEDAPEQDAPETPEAALEVEEEGDEPQVKSPAMSFKERLHARHEELAKQTTELFAVPRYEDVVMVELRVIKAQESEEITRRLTRGGRIDINMTTQQAQEIVEATVGFHAVLDYDDEGRAIVEPVEDASWKSIAEGLVDLPAEAGQRPAMVALCGSVNVQTLWGMWRAWLMGKDVGIRQEVVRDFTRTP